MVQFRAVSCDSIAGSEFPILDEIGFIDDKNEGDFTDFFANALFELEGFFESIAASSVGDEKIASSRRAGRSNAFSGIHLHRRDPKEPGRCRNRYGERPSCRF